MFRRLQATPLALLLGAIAVAAVALSVSALGTDTPAARATERTVTAVKGVVQATVSGSGSLEPRSTHDLSFSASGKVTAVEVRAGDTVRKGQLLAKIDPSSAEAALAQAKADLQDAEDALDTASDSSSSSSSDSSSSATSTASAQAKVDADRLTVADAQDALDGTRLYAPVSGTIADVGVSVGDAVSSGSTAASSSSASSATGGDTATTSSSTSTAAITLVNLKRYKMTVSLSESDVGKVKAGQAATVTVNAAGSEELAARVLAVDLLSSSSSSSTTSSSSASAVSYSVTLELTQSAAALKPGMSATAEIVTSQTSGLVVPTAAISGGTVTVIKNGVKSARQVQTGVAGDSVTQVTSGLSAGEQVVVTSASATAGAAASSSSTTSSSSSGGQQQTGSGLAGAAAGGGTGGPPGGTGGTGGAPGGGTQ
jgi:multidrug efflux pump subunit AcrA (membrane-fusion protein)